MEYIDNLVDIDKYYLYYKNKPILSAESPKHLKKSIKLHIEPPKKDIKVFVVNFRKYKSNKKLLAVSCIKFTITTNLELIAYDEDIGQVVTYSKAYLEQNKFKLSDIVKIIKAIDSNKISLETSFVPIQDIILI